MRELQHQQQVIAQIRQEAEEEHRMSLFGSTAALFSQSSRQPVSDDYVPVAMLQTVLDDMAQVYDMALFCGFYRKRISILFIYFFTPPLPLRLFFSFPLSALGSPNRLGTCHIPDYSCACK